MRMRKPVTEAVIRISLTEYCSSNWHGANSYTEKIILLKDLKILLNIDLKTTLLDYQNNYTGNLKMMSNATKSVYSSNQFKFR